MGAFVRLGWPITGVRVIVKTCCNYKTGLFMLLLAIFSSVVGAADRDRFLSVRDGERGGNAQRHFSEPPQRGLSRRDGYRERDEGNRSRQQRLSPEERQQLRRDIRDAGRNIYPGRP